MSRSSTKPPEWVARVRDLNFLVFLLPACRTKNMLLRALGDSVAADTRVGPCLVSNVRRFELGPGAHIGVGNVFRDLKLVSLADHARIGQWNWVTATLTTFREEPSGGALIIGRHSSVVSRHYLDCSGVSRSMSSRSLLGCAQCSSLTRSTTGLRRCPSRASESAPMPSSAPAADWPLEPRCRR